MSACAAIASASSANAAVEKIVNATCQPASSSVPSPVATTTVASSAIRSDSVRRNSQPPERAEPLHALAVRTDGCRVPACEPPDHDHVRGDHAPLGDDRAGRGAGDAPAEAVDEEPVEERVRGEPEPGDPQRRDGVLHAAQEPGRGEDDEHRRQPPHRDAEVGHGLLPSTSGVAPNRPTRNGVAR